MKIDYVNIEGKQHLYLFIYKNPSLPIINLEQDEITTRFEKIGSSRFYRMSSGELCKISTDRLNTWSLSWFLRDILERRCFLKSPAVKEWRNNIILSKLGIKTVPIDAVAIACMPSNRLSSLLVMPLLTDMRSGEDYYNEANYLARNDLFQHIARDVALSAYNGYGHRDLHLGNLMVNSLGDIVWIDTHLKKLPKGTSQRKKHLSSMFHERKLFGSSNKIVLQSMALEYYETLEKNGRLQF
jgi:tRNA A-37 threonylcarbamoyl transferase component Bud32